MAFGTRVRSTPRFLSSLLLGFAVSAAVLGASPAFADDTADEAELQFELGADAYQKGDYKGAVEHFLASNRLSPNPNVTYNIARAYEKLGRFPEAFRYYQYAGSPQALEAMRSLEKHVAILEVKTDPPGATIYVDRIDLGARGESPRLLGLGPGKYRVIAQKAGYRSAEIVLDAIAAGERREVSLHLEPLLGDVTAVGPNVEGATLSADTAAGHLECVLPCSLKLPPGPIVVTATRPGYRSTESVVDVIPEGTQRVVTRLEPATGVVSVEADETGALVELDGKPAGYTPAMLRAPVGKHQIRVSFPGKEPISKEVEVHEESPERISLELERQDKVVAASRRAERSIEAPSSVTVIPAEELRLFSYPTLLEALRGSPGMYQWDDRAYPTIGIRGQGRLGSYGNRVLVLLDDHAMNDSWAGSSYAGYQHRTDLSDVERIEIVRGPGSVLYGTNAFAGVVNVVTRPAAEKSGGEVGASVAQDGVGRVRARGDYRFDKNTAVWASAAYGKSAGNTYTLDSGTANQPLIVAQETDNLETATGQIKLAHKKLTVTAMATSADKGVGQGYYATTVGDPLSRNRDTRGFAEVRFEPELTKELGSVTILSGDLYQYSGFFPRPTADGGLEHDQYHGLWSGLEQRFVYSPIEALRLTAGGVGQYHFRADQFVDYDGVPSLDEKRNVTVGAGYGMVDAYLPRLRISAGARYDAYGTAPRDCTGCTESTFGSSLNPRVALIGTPYGDGTTKLLIGKAFRAPSVSEMFYNDGGFSQRASPDLKPEELWSFEVQHLHQFTKNVQGSAGVYLTKTTNQVVDAASSPTDPFHYVNSPVPLATAGGEFRLRREWAQGWMIEGSYSLMFATYLESDDFGALLTWKKSDDFQKVANVPNNLFALKGALPILRRLLTLGSRLTAETGRYTWQETPDAGKQVKTEAYILWDLVLGGEEPTTGLRYSLGVYNVFDTRYRLPVGSEFNAPTMVQQGRSLLADVSLRF